MPVAWAVGGGAAPILLGSPDAMETLSFRPRACVWELTLACNLRCEHCGSSAGRPRASELSTAECLDVVRQLADLECRLITLSGGEPTLRDDWEPIARAAIERGITVNMVTNGTTITDEVARRIAGSGLVNVAVSIDGPEELHDGVRGRGNFRRAVRGLERLRAAGVVTAVITHLDQRSAACIEDVHDIAVSAGARSFRVQLGKPMGELAFHADRLLRPPDLLWLLPRLAALKIRSPIWVDVGDSIGYFGPHERILRKKAWDEMAGVWTGCQAGRFAIGIESDGGVKGCLSLQAGLEGSDRDVFREGSLREQRLEEIWFSPAAFAFNRRPAELTGFCGRCSNARICRGGAKCVAAAFTGRLGEDPYCWHRASELAAAGRGRAVTAVAAAARQRAAATVLGLGISACFGGCSSGSTDSLEARGADAAAFSATGAPDAAVLLRMDAAIAAPDASAPPDAETAPDPCRRACPTCEYGVEPPCPVEPDAGVSDAGARPPDAGARPPDAGASPDAGALSDAGAVSCENVCCDCDYGIAPPPGCC